MKLVWFHSSRVVYSCSLFSRCIIIIRDCDKHSYSAMRMSTRRRPARPKHVVLPLNLSEICLLDGDGIISTTDEKTVMNPPLQSDSPAM